VNGDDGNDEIHAELVDKENAIQGGSGNDELYIKGTNNYLDGNDGNDYLFLDGAGSSLHGSEGDDILEAIRGDNFYKGGPGADDFKCSLGPGDEVQDYHPEEADTVSADCEIINQ
jgi:hypothetical protein